jgi:microcin C transport system ATP-binding protein
MSLLEVANLSVAFNTQAGVRVVVDDVSFNLNAGEITALVGESGSGKTLSALSILRLLPYPQCFHPQGRIYFSAAEEAEKIDLLKLKDVDLQKIRGCEISMVFQEPMTALNPLHNIGKQVSEAITTHRNISGAELAREIKDLFADVELAHLVERQDAYPHLLSGGERQRLLLAIALANKPKILIADEPTTALDSVVKQRLLALIQNLARKRNMAVLIITHDLPLVKFIADKVIVMKDGKIVEENSCALLFKNPLHAYTQMLLQSEAKGQAEKFPADSEIVLESKNLTVRFSASAANWFGKKNYKIGLNSIDLQIKQGETLGVVGESGSGKTTLALALLRLIAADAEITLQGRRLDLLRGEELRKIRRSIQMVFQDPFASLNPRMNVSECIAEGLRAHDLFRSEADLQKRVKDELVAVGLGGEYSERYPHELSGGQRQRVAIARALILDPQIVILDEPTSALDLSVQAHVLDLLKNLQKKRNLSYLLITHDLSVVRAMAHRILVLRSGEVVEEQNTEDFFASPKTEYAKQMLKLLAAA